MSAIGIGDDFNYRNGRSDTLAILKQKRVAIGIATQIWNQRSEPCIY